MKRKISELLFATDMDDTILDSQKRISARNREAIAAFEAQGGRFTIATGRAVPATEPYVKELGLTLPVILYNGAAIYDYKEERFVWTAALPPESREYFREIMDAYPMIGAEILMGEDIYVLRKNEHICRHVDIEKLEYTEVTADELPDGWFKILFVMDEDLLDEVWDFIQGRHYEGVDFVKSSVNYLEMMPSGVSKGKTLLRLAEILGIRPENTIGIGDYNNDIELIRDTGLGFAVENAPAEVRAVADQIAPDCNHDAVAWALAYTAAHLEEF